MAAVHAKPISNIAVAFAAQSPSVNIPKPRDGGYSAFGNANNAGMLPTPPNSISPTLPPQKIRPFAVTEAPSTNLDSDIDLQDATEREGGHETPQTLSSAALSGLEAAGAITPTMLAKHHLPDILLANGPMAIRHVLGHLTQTVPGFSGIPPAKARRIVVAALENRGGGGINGDVIFDKVGWGRWDARLKGQAPSDGMTGQQNGSRALSVPDGPAQLGVSPPASVPGSYTLSSVGGFRIPDAGRRWADGRRDLHSGASWAAESTLSSREEEMIMGDMEMHDADKMSLDDHPMANDSCGSSSAPDDLHAMDDDPEDVTDEEDWARIGPDALRRSSYNASGSIRLPHRNYNHLALSTSRVKAMSISKHRKPSLAMSPPSHQHKSHAYIHPGVAARPTPLSMTSSSFGHYGVLGQADCDSQEREAIEALLRMGCM